MCNNWQSGAENERNERLASNQVVGGSNPSERAIFFNDLTHFRKLASAHKNKNIKVVNYGCGAIVGSDIYTLKYEKKTLLIIEKDCYQ